jgi:hypothetical protein
MLQEFVIRLEGLETANANVMTSRLRQELLDLGEPKLDAKLRKESRETMDAGSTIALILAAPSAVAVARGIAQWIAREGERAGKLVIETPAGKVVATGHAAKNIDVAKAVSALTQKQS